ncbi:50S ribosomal protein L19 [Patescibacteria group bacterium]
MANRLQILDTTICVGDTIKVHQKVLEKDKERIQIFQGIVIRIKGHSENKSFTVRKIATGAVGVERIWPVVSPWIVKVEIVKKGKVRRAKLYYLRERIGKRAVRVKTKKIEKTEKIKTAKKEDVKKAKSALKTEKIDKTALKEKKAKVKKAVKK